jgi:ABC-type phosphate transport system substrate-binding protein
MKRRFITGILVIALGLSGCGTPESAEAVVTTATTAAATFEMSTVAETTAEATTSLATTFTTTEPTPEIEKTFPIIDGSTSTINLDAYIRSELLGISIQDALYDTQHNKTFESFENLVNGKADIVLSVPLAKEQEAYAAEHNFEYEAVPVALEGFVFLVNPENPVQSLTQEQIRRIYSGDITNWKELGGNDAPIKAHQRNNNSGSQTYMTAFMGETPLAAAPDSLVEGEMGAIISMFENYDNSIDAIGYSVYSYAAVFAANEGTFNFVAVDGVKPSRATFIDGTYPLLSQTYAFYKKDTNDPLILDYIEFITSKEGQNTVLEAGYIPVMNIEIPSAYTLYEAKGTGTNMPENRNLDSYSLYFGYNKRIRGFLKDTEFEAEIQIWIDEQLSRLDDVPARVSQREPDIHMEIKNGYLGVRVGYRETPGVYDLVRFYGSAAVFDIINQEKINELSDLYFKDTDFLPDIENEIFYEITEKSYYDTPKIDFFGLGSDFSFDLSTVYMNRDNAYFNIPAAFDVSLSERDISLISECRDFSDLITDEYEDRIQFTKYEPSDKPSAVFYLKGELLYVYYDYSDIEDDRELPENKHIEEALDAYYKDNPNPNSAIRAYADSDYVYIYVMFDNGSLRYNIAEHKFDGFVLNE